MPCVMLRIDTSLEKINNHSFIVNYCLLLVLDDKFSINPIILGFFLVIKNPIGIDMNREKRIHHMEGRTFFPSSPISSSKFPPNCSISSIYTISQISICTSRICYYKLTVEELVFTTRNLSDFFISKHNMQINKNYDTKFVSL